MRAASHVVLGLVTLAVCEQTGNLYHPADAWPIAIGGLLLANVIGSLLPDADSDESEIRQITGTARHDGCLGWLVSKLMPGHRGITHSAGVMILLAVAVGVTGNGFVQAFAVGYVMHIAADMLTHSGVPIFWPLKLRFGLLPKQLRFSTGSLSEFILVALASGWLIVFLLQVSHAEVWWNEMRRIWIAIKQSI